MCMEWKCVEWRHGIKKVCAGWWRCMGWNVWVEDVHGKERHVEER